MFGHCRQTSYEPECGQVAQVVERSPEKAGVGGSTPSLATIPFSHLHGLAFQCLGAIGCKISGLLGKLPQQISFEI